MMEIVVLLACLALLAIEPARDFWIKQHSAARSRPIGRHRAGSGGTPSRRIIAREAHMRAFAL